MPVIRTVRRRASEPSPTRRLHETPLYSNVMATAAMFIALGGTSYAAAKITGAEVRDGTLTGRDVRNGSLSGRDVRNGSLRAADIAPGQIPVSYTHLTLPTTPYV